MTGLYPYAEPHARGWLPRGLHRLYYEESGNPRGRLVIVLHGGPGSGSNPTSRGFFDPAFYRVVLFDQRGCGQSTPLGAVQENSLPFLLEDMEALRAHLGVERWLVCGGSWGATLALAYARAHPSACAGLLLRGVFLGTEEEVHWYLQGLARFLPDAWEAFSRAVPGEESLLERYHRALHGTNRNLALAAARAWEAYEQRAMGLVDPVSSEPPPPEKLLAKARIQTHYLVHGCFLDPGGLLRGVPNIRHIPCTLVQGRLDLICPPVAAFRLKAAWPEARLILVEGGGHSAGSPAIGQAMLAAGEAFKARLESASCA
ncbi:prolyl aminopeptidase [Pelomicrobium sp. G1]|uniref:prolyl aminopeptidase n=1 Tax=unclassified Pelomicrobium TaxID=2815318 RepID=UPI003F76AA68